MIELNFAYAKLRQRQCLPLGKVVYLAPIEMSEKSEGPIPYWGLIRAQLRIHFEDILEPYLAGMN